MNKFGKQEADFRAGGPGELPKTSLGGIVDQEFGVNCDNGFVFSSTSLDTGCRDESALLIHRGGRLVAILVRLDDEIHGPLRGKWNLEAGFGRYAGERPSPFDSIADCEKWLASLGRELAPASTELRPRIKIRAFSDDTQSQIFSAISGG